MSGRTVAHVVGAVLGLLFVGYVLFYVPMSQNYAECGQITLCPKAPPR